MNWNSIERKGFHGAQTRLSIFMGTKRRRLRMVNNKTHSHANEAWLSLGNSMWPDQHERPEIPSEKNLEQVSEVSNTKYTKNTNCFACCPFITQSNSTQMVEHSLCAIWRPQEPEALRYSVSTSPFNAEHKPCT